MSERILAVAMSAVAVVVVAFAGFVLVHQAAPPRYTPVPQTDLSAPPVTPAPRPTVTPTATPTASPSPSVAPDIADDFARADAASVGSAPTGGPWTVSGAGGARLLDGRAVTETDGRGYLSQVLTTNVARRMQATGSFIGSSDLGVTMFSSKDTDGSLADGVDLEVTPTRYVLGLRQAGGAYESLAQGPLSLAAAGTAYTWSMLPTAKGATLNLPDGTTRFVADPRIASVSGGTCSWEVRSEGASSSRLDAAAAYPS